MNAPNDPAQLSRRTVGRVLGGTRHAENHDRRKYNGANPPGWRAPPGDRHLWPIKVSGSETTPNLYPAVLRAWAEYDDPDHVFADFGTEEIWAFPPPDSGISLDTDTEYLGAFVGFHTDGLGVYEVIPAGGGTPVVTWGGVVFSFLNTQSNDLTAFPSGYSRLSTLSGTALPTITDTVRFLFNAEAPAGGRTAAGLLVPQFSLFVKPVSGGTYGHFVVMARTGAGVSTFSTHNLGAIDYPAASGNPAHACGSPSLPFSVLVPEGQDFVDLDVYYSVLFFSNVAWGGAACPDMIFRACTSGYMQWADHPTAETNREADRGTDVGGCPAVVTI